MSFSPWRARHGKSIRAMNSPMEPRRGGVWRTPWRGTLMDIYFSIVILVPTPAGHRPYGAHKILPLRSYPRLARRGLQDVAATRLENQFGGALAHGRLAQSG
jgi:hypothetical protein